MAEQEGCHPDSIESGATGLGKDMRVHRKTRMVVGIGILLVVMLGLGWLWAHPMPAAGLVVGFGYLLYRRTFRKRRAPKEPSAPPADAPKPVVSRSADPTDPNNVVDLVERMLSQGRFTLLLRPQIAQNLSEEQLARARAALEDAMALVPDGEVTLSAQDEARDDDEPGANEYDYREETAGAGDQVIRVERFFLDRYPVTNRQFYEFVAGGGYEQLALWDEEIWPAVLDFVDETGHPGPRFWKDGAYPTRLGDHPVVGVSWYEANAFARWMGKRLPTEPEWVKAGSWPVSLSSNARVQRKYPWGDTMDRSRVNLWGSGHNGTISVEQLPEGVSVGGVYHLIGNVWEWTRGSFNAGIPQHHGLVLDVPMKSVRGGAFDTYLDNQATCQFQSGEVPMARKRNIGFRCGVGVCDLAPRRRGSDSQPAAEPQDAFVEEVQV
jgi:iron(II)-dependent oxidoreductase